MPLKHRKIGRRFFVSIIVPQDYHIKEVLQQRRVHCISEAEAQRQDIRPLRIGILNIMPKAEAYEYSMLFPLGRSIIQIEPVWLKLHHHRYASSNREHVNNLYKTFDEAVKHRGFDGIVVTGAPVEGMKFEDVSYWEELKEILAYARKHIVSTLGICWGGLALAGYLGIEKITYPEKLFGVYPTRNLQRDHRITGDLDDVFPCPQSRHSGIHDREMEQAEQDREVNLLAHSNYGGYTIFESSDKRFVMHLGHPEYQTERLIEEYERDRKQGKEQVRPPENLDLEQPANTWRSNGLEFFQQWVKQVYLDTPFHI